MFVLEERSWSEIKFIREVADGGGRRIKLLHNELSCISLGEYGVKSETEPRATPRQLVFACCVPLTRAIRRAPRNESQTLNVNDFFQDFITRKE